MSFKLFKDVLHWSKNDLFGWADTWQSFVNGRWFSVSVDRWPNSFDDRTGNFKLHPQTIKKLLRDDLAEQLDYADRNSRIAKGGYNEWATIKPQIKLRLTEKGQGLVDYECKIQALEDEPCQCRRCMFDSHDGSDYCYEIARNIDEDGNYHDDEGNYRDGQNHEVIA